MDSKTKALIVKMRTTCERYRHTGMRAWVGSKTRENQTDLFKVSDVEALIAALEGRKCTSECGGGCKC